MVIVGGGTQERILAHNSSSSDVYLVNTIAVDLRAKDAKWFHSQVWRIEYSSSTVYTNAIGDFGIRKPQ
jgi:hypothetical protein